MFIWLHSFDCTAQLSEQWKETYVSTIESENCLTGLVEACLSLISCSASPGSQCIELHSTGRVDPSKDTDTRLEMRILGCQGELYILGLIFDSPTFFLGEIV